MKLALSILQPFASHGCLVGRKDKRVRVVNLLQKNSQPLTLHGASHDDDLGFHKIVVGQNYEWTFCPTFLCATLFFCHFWWVPKQVAFDVYNQQEYNLRRHLNVFIVKSDGIYLTHDQSQSSLEKFVSW